MEEKELQLIESAIKMAGLATKEMLSFKEAAKLIGVKDSYLYKLTSGQKIPHYKPMGKMLYFNRKELEAWLQQNRISTTDEIEAKAQSYCMSNKLGGAK